MRDGAVATLRWHVVCGRVLHERLLTYHRIIEILLSRGDDVPGFLHPWACDCAGALFQNADARHFLFNDVALLTGMTLNHKKYLRVQCGAEECAVLLERIATSCPEFRDMEITRAATLLGTMMDGHLHGWSAPRSKSRRTGAKTFASQGCLIPNLVVSMISALTIFWVRRVPCRT